MYNIPGIDMAAGLLHMGSRQEIYLRFLKRFPEDASFSSLAQALRDGSMHDAFLCAHTLKGLTAQLGITALQIPFAALCDILRDPDPAMLPLARRQLTELTPIYLDIVRQIRLIP